MLYFAAEKINWNFPRALNEVWGGLPLSRRHEIALECAGASERRNIPFTIRLLSTRLHFRSTAVAALPSEQLATHIVAFAHDDGDALDELFRVYFSCRHKKMMAKFLDQLPDSHSNGSPELIKTRSDFENAIATLLREFAPDDVALYTQVLSCQNPTAWDQLPLVDFEAIGTALRNGDRIARVISVRQEEPAAIVPDPVVATNGSLKSSAQNPPPPIPFSDKRKSDENDMSSDLNANPQIVPDNQDTTPDSTGEDARSLLSELADVLDLFDRTADQFTVAASELRQGKVPAGLGGNVIDSVAQAFTAIGDRVRARSEELGISHSEEALSSLSDLAPAITAIEEAEKAREETLRRTRVLEQVLSLKMADGRNFQPLNSLHVSAQTLRDELLNAGSHPPDSAQLDRLHGFELVLQMVDSESEGGTSDNSQDENAEDVVAKQFGAKLLYALGTGKIVRSSVNSSATGTGERKISPSAELPLEIAQRA